RGIYSLHFTHTWLISLTLNVTLKGYLLQVFKDTEHFPRPSGHPTADFGCLFSRNFHPEWQAEATAGVRAADSD
ncbi:hypothetical protein CEXT_86671, partial [Caerostris extrusa]